MRSAEPKRRVIMGYSFGIAMEIMFDAAMAVLMFKTVIKAGTPARVTSVTTGVGFLLYAAFSVMRGSYVGFVLALLGFMLSYATFVFTFSRE